MHLSWTLSSLDSTDALGAALAGQLRAGDVLALHGELGAGKTTLVRAIAQAVGVNPALVSSPTFVIVNEYPVETCRGVGGVGGDDPTDSGTNRPAKLVHVDAYRLTSPEDLDALGWDQLDDGSSVLLIEWAQRITDALDPIRTAHLTLTHTDTQTRKAKLQLPDAWTTRPGFNTLTQLLTHAGLGINPAEKDDSAHAAPRTETICPVTGAHVPAESPTWPFVSEQARMADLYKWFSGQHAISRPIEQTDLEEEV